MYSACLATNIIWSLLMIFLITLGLSLCAPSLRPSPPSSTSLPGCPLSSASPLRPSSVTTGGSSITPPLGPSSYLGVFSCVCLVRIPLLRMYRGPSRGPCIGIIYTHPSRVGRIQKLFSPLACSDVYLLVMCGC